jgi:hypothetical protein
MIRRLLRVAVFALCLGPVAAWAETLALPSTLVDFQSAEGQQLLLESSAHEAYFPLASNFVTQKTQAYCGVASIVMVLNSLQVPAPTTPEYAPYHTFTQDNLLDEHSDAILPRALLARQGMTMEQLSAILALQPVAVEMHHASDSNLDAFRAAAVDYLGKRDHFVVINFLRKAIGEEIGGHWSPIAAYDGKTDRFLLLDVARYKYPPVWVKASDLFEAMNTRDSANDNKTRGYVLVTKIASKGN